MKDFKHTSQILIDAYNAGTLKNKSCETCAIGTIMRHYGFQGNEWSYIFATTFDCRDRMMHHLNPEKLEQRSYIGSQFEIVTTGYDWKELSHIEHQFEVVAHKEGLTAGLYAAIHALADVHGMVITDDIITEMINPTTNGRNRTTETRKEVQAIGDLCTGIATREQVHGRTEPEVQRSEYRTVDAT